MNTHLLLVESANKDGMVGHIATHICVELSANYPFGQFTMQRFEEFCA